MTEFNHRPQERQTPLDALKFEDTKDKINLSYAKRRYHLPEYLESYTGVCDVIKPEEARAMADELRKSRKDPKRKIMIGVMAGPYSLHHEDGDDMPRRDEIAKAFTDDPDVLNTVHFADLYNRVEKKPWRAGEAPGILENLELCVEYGGENLHAIQLDVTWPDAKDLKEFRERHPNISIILQVGKFAIVEAENDPQNITDKLRQYGDSIDYVLLDLSMGKGRRMTEIEIINLERLLNLIQYELPSLSLAVAGGLGPNLEARDSLEESTDQMYALRRIAKEFPNISTDAQGALKPQNAPRGYLDHFDATVPADLDRSISYINEVSAILDNNIAAGSIANAGSRKPSYIAI